MGMFAKLLDIKPPEQKPESYRQIMRNLGDAMYVASFGSNKVAFSKSLL